MKNIKNDILWRIYLLYICIIIFALVIFGKAVYTQFAEGEELVKKAKAAPIRLIDTEVEKGNIYADDGSSLLVTSIPIFDVRMDVASPTISDDLFFSNVDSLAICLSKLFNDKTTKEYKNQLLKARKNGNRFLLLGKDVTYNQLKIIKTFPIFKLGKNKGGLRIDSKEKRELIYRDLAARTIGYERNGIIVGLEGTYSKELNGVAGKRLVHKTAENEWKPIREDDEIEAQNGYDIITTIDIKIQDIAESALRKCLDTNKADHGCAILMEVKTGHVKAIANLTKTGEHKYEERYNYAIGERVEPGSTFKLMSLVAVMEDGLADTNTQVNIKGASTVYFNREMKDSHDPGLGIVNMKTIFEISSNVGVSKIIYKAYANNPQKFTERLYEMGVNEPLGLKIFGETNPIIKNPKFRSWSNTTLPWMSIGYELLITPFQILAFYNAIANDGIMVRPLFVKEIRRTGKLIQSFDTEILNKSICSKETIAKAKCLLEGVVQNGTAKKQFKNSYFKVAGKTGTAQIAQQNSGYNKNNYRASFVGYFPADNPQYSCIVIVHNPQSGKYYGGEVAAPVFKEIADKIYASKLNIQYDLNLKDTITREFVKSGNTADFMTISKSLGIIPDKIISENEWSTFAIYTQAANKQKKATQLDKRTITNGIVPNVVGMNAKDAVYLLETAGLDVKITGKGTVKKQSMEPGAKAEKNSQILIELSI